MTATAYIAANSMLPELTHVELGGESIEIEGLCLGVLKRLEPGVQPPLEPCERDDALAFLLGEVYVQARLYDASRAGTAIRTTGRTPARSWLFDRIGKRLIDEWRSRRCFGRAGQYRAPVRVDDDDLGMDRLESAPAAIASDCPEAGPDDLERLYARGDRETLREERRLGLDTDRRTPTGDHRAGARAVVRVERRAPSEDRVDAPWRDCEGCGWRAYAQAPNGYPGWHYPERCPACGCGLA
jgi:hypothetical protein